MGRNRTITCACCGQPGRGAGRGLIDPCRAEHERRDELLDFPRQTLSSADMLDTYRICRGRMPHATYRELAEEMGVTQAALERAIARDRARARSDTTPPPFEGQKETTMGKLSDDDAWASDYNGNAEAFQLADDEAAWEVAEQGGLLDRLPPMTAEQREAAVQRLAVPARADDPAELQARIEAIREGVREEEAAAALMNTPAWQDASPAEREAVRERWLGDEVGDAIEGINTQRTDERLRRESASQVQGSRDAGWTPPVGYEYRRPDVSRGSFDGYGGGDDGEQWRAPGTAGHDEYWWCGQLEAYDDRSDGRSDTAGF